MKSNWISRLDFFKLGFVSIIALPLSSIGARTDIFNAHPQENIYVSPDCRFAFFNSTASGIPHIYCASVPEKFLESLER